MNKHTPFILLLSLAFTVSCKQESGSKETVKAFASSLTSSSGAALVNALQSVAAPEAYQFNSRYVFSKNFVRPLSKQGIGDARTEMSAAELSTRYAKLKGLGVAYKEYNFWWSGLESSGLTSSSTPIACPAGYQLFPANEAEKVAKGYNKYRCIHLPYLANFDNLFKRDQDAGIQTGIVMWSSPAVYRYSGCQGFAWASGTLKDGCVPRDDAMDDFEDYANFLASRYNGGAFGKISHFIVWNENASPGWFDYTPVTSNTKIDSANVEKRIDKLADMMKRVHAALVRHQKGALMYVSTDMLWTPGLHEGHFGSKWLIDGLWARLGLNYSWSVAVHPYGDVDQTPGEGTYTFNNLDMVVDHQNERLQQLGVRDPSTYPQSILIASEQGWPLTTAAGMAGVTGREYQARQICLAHDKVMSLNQVVVVAHNYFQSVEPFDSVENGTSGQGAFFGLIPYEIPNDLSGLETTATGKAYISTLNPGNWKQRDDHYCCDMYKLGCRENSPNKVASVEETHQVTGVIDSVSQVGNQNIISGWACTRGMDKSIAVHLYIGNTLIGGYLANKASEPAVAKSCGTNAAAYRFQIPLEAQTVNAYSGKTFSVFGISSLNLANNPLMRSGSLRIPAPIIENAALNSVPKIPIYRFFNGYNHLLTTLPSEGENAKYTSEGFAFYMFAQSAQYIMNPMYRCLNGAEHFISTDPKCEKTKTEGLMGYLLREKAPGTKEVYRFYKHSTGQHLITTNKAEGLVNGFVLEAVLGYTL